MSRAQDGFQNFLDLFETDEDDYQPSTENSDATGATEDDASEESEYLGEIQILR